MDNFFEVIDQGLRHDNLQPKTLNIIQARTLLRRPLSGPIAQLALSGVPGVPVPSRGCPEPNRSVPVGPSLTLFGALLTAVSQHQCRLIPKRAAIFQRCCEASS